MGVFIEERNGINKNTATGWVAVVSALKHRHGRRFASCGYVEVPH